MDRGKLSSLTRRYHRLASATVAACLAVFAAVVCGPRPANAAGSAPAATASISSAGLQRQIGTGQVRVSALSGAVSAANDKVSKLASGISALQGQIKQIQGKLNSNRNQLLKLRDQQTAAEARLGRLQASERGVQSALSEQLVGSYEGDNPDIVSVVLESSGFDNLLERLAFASRIGDHDAQVVDGVQAARRAVAAQASQLGALSVHQQQLTVNALHERDQLGRARLALVKQQLAASSAKSSSASQLAGARSQLDSLRGQLVKLQTGPPGSSAASGRAGRGSASVGRGSASAGAFAFPMPKSDVSPPATWSAGNGVDIAAPGGTPELAVCSGTVVLHGVGGLGPSTPVLHCDSPLAGYGYVYYGHAGHGHWVKVGTHLSRGQIISEVAPGIVGISDGPHLELGFADSTGSPVGPSSAAAMMSLLRSAYTR
jgi:murein DD-endopeptidase MepM/ murein hydrolase activator NlpD